MAYNNSVSGKFDLNGWPIHYNIFGTGSEIVLLIPGVIGTAKSDYLKQLEGPHAFDFKRFTFVAVELPGWGRSRPPPRIFDTNVFKNDSEICFQLMTNLGFETFSIISWSDGARVALVMCDKNPNRVKSAVVIAIAIKFGKRLIEDFVKTRDIKLWSTEQLDRYMSVYGDEHLVQQLWDEIIDFFKAIKNGLFLTEDNPHQYLLKPEELKTIRTPVLIVYGDEDPLVSKEQILEIEKYIPDSVVHKFIGGSHNSHQEFSAQFKKIVENFLENCDNCF